MYSHRTECLHNVAVGRFLLRLERAGERKYRCGLLKVRMGHIKVASWR